MFERYNLVAVYTVMVVIHTSVLMCGPDAIFDYCFYYMLPVIAVIITSWKKIQGLANATPQKPIKWKLACKTLETKYLTIQAVEAGVKRKAQITKEFGIPANTLSTWLRKEGIKLHMRAPHLAQQPSR